MITSTKTFEGSTSFTLNYHLYLPQDYNESAKEYPLILFLHGAGERGDSKEDLGRVLTQGLPQYIKNHPDFPFIVVMPQCPTNSYWPIQVENLKVLLDSVIKELRVDEDQVYLTGLSMGGYGTWYLSYSYPERFAAIAPICGAGIPSCAQRLAKMPIWVFHGGKDPVVPVFESEFLVNRLREAGNDVKFTVYPEEGHGSWVPAYNTDELYTWFLSHRRK